MTDNIMELKDIYGNTVFIEPDEVFQTIVKNNYDVKIYGMDLKTIAKVRRYYISTTGNIP